MDGHHLVPLEGQNVFTEACLDEDALNGLMERIRNLLPHGNTSHPSINPNIFEINNWNCHKIRTSITGNV